MLIPSELSALVIDDNDHSGALAKHELKKVGLVDIHVVSDVITALETLKSNTIHFVLLDWYMPEVNGAGFVCMVRKGLAHCNTKLPIIVTTAYATRENTARIRELGLREILIKPFNSKQLSKAISIAISQLAQEKLENQTTQINPSELPGDPDDNDEQILL
ncbi:MAG: response regulator [Devosiaceae bacterium]|nr:response regulator [Devosiaceae bacterium]